MGTVLTDPPSVENLFNSVGQSDLNADVYKKKILSNSYLTTKKLLRLSTKTSARQD